MPVEVLGFDGVCEAGERVQVVENDRRARQLAERARQPAQDRGPGPPPGPHGSRLEEVFAKAQRGRAQGAQPLLKADVSGSLEALQDEIAKLPQDEVAVNIIHAAAGGINESDVMLAAASDAIIIGFNVRPLADARRAAEDEGVEIRTYSVIYKVTEELRDCDGGHARARGGRGDARRGRGARDLQGLAGRHDRRLPGHRGQDHRDAEVAPGPRGHRRLDRQGSARCAASRTTSRRSRRARSAASCSRASRTSRSATSSSSSRPRRSRRRWSSAVAGRLSAVVCRSRSGCTSPTRDPEVEAQARRARSRTPCGPPRRRGRRDRRSGHLAALDAARALVGRERGRARRRRSDTPGGDRPRQVARRTTSARRCAAWTEPAGRPLGGT